MLGDRAGPARPGRPPARALGAGPLRCSPTLALAGGVFFAYSFAGLAWPFAIVALWSLTAARGARGAARRGRCSAPSGGRGRCSSLLVLAGLGVLALIGPFGFGGGFNKVAGSNTYGPVSPFEALGVWPASNYRLDAAGGAHLTGLAAAIGVLALLLGALWWVRRRELAVPIGARRLRRPLPALRSRSAATTRRRRR